MRRPLFHRLLTGLTALLFLAAVMGFAAHGYEAKGASHDESTCNFCVELSATAGPASIPACIQPFLSSYCILIVQDRDTPFSHRGFPAHQARAPPQSFPV